MKACRIEIVSETEGTRTRFLYRGIAEVFSPFELFCRTEDGGTELSVGKNFLAVRRALDTELVARFEDGKETSLVLSAEGGRAEIPVSAVRCVTLFQKDGALMRLVYTLLYEIPQTFSLKIRIKIISEDT